jgi:hypothetical protein
MRDQDEMPCWPIGLTALRREKPILPASLAQRSQESDKLAALRTPRRISAAIGTPLASQNISDETQPRRSAIIMRCALAKYYADKTDEAQDDQK